MAQVQQQYYIDLFLPFGLCSSPAIFNQYTDVLEFAMQANGIRDLLHYLDDYFMAGPAGSGKCQHNISTMVKVCRELGFAVNPSKVTAPSPVTCFLSIDIDSSAKGLPILTQSTSRQSHAGVSPVSNRPSWQPSGKYFPSSASFISFAGCAPLAKLSCTG